jgi:predicted RNA binding protein YcfA (HicA-like mRNA interferase family)
MPSARADEFRRVAALLGFRKARQTGSHERWKREDGRSRTIPIHGGRQIGPPLFYRILNQLGIDENELDRLR